MHPSIDGPSTTREGSSNHPSRTICNTTKNMSSHRVVHGGRAEPRQKTNSTEAHLTTSCPDVLAVMATKGGNGVGLPSNACCRMRATSTPLVRVIMMSRRMASNLVSESVRG